MSIGKITSLFLQNNFWGKKYKSKYSKQIYIRLLKMSVRKFDPLMVLYCLLFLFAYCLYIEFVLFDKLNIL